MDSDLKFHSHLQHILLMTRRPTRILMIESFDIPEQCFLHLPYPYQSLLRSVSPSWNKALTYPNFHLSKISHPPHIRLRLPRLLLIPQYPMAVLR
ncbi:hypothetical protein Scep_002634 [Stephania cephalantha]|uniref:Uncharacterized protein n=1 Tax=Stephania cephalantha TaxID=152367 RepID=A0AAP0LAC1_9MAGN